MNNISFRIMRIISLFSIPRTIAIKLIALKKRVGLPEFINDAFKVDSGTLLNDVKEKGFSRKFSIPSQYLKDIIEYCKTADFTDIVEGKTFKIDYDNPQKPKSQGLWYQHNNSYQQNSTIQKLAHDHQMLNIAKSYLGTYPQIKSVTIWWSFPPNNAKPNHEYGFHYDIDAYKFIKFFIYLVDVDENCGPHSIISGTHKSKNLFEKRNRRLTDEDVKNRYDKNSIITMIGKAGEGFLEDTFTYHKGTTPKKPRLMLQVEYTL
jgi:Phytanoyl-CoA dioxygenase (PhyH)